MYCTFNSIYLTFFKQEDEVKLLHGLYCNEDFKIKAHFPQKLTFIVPNIILPAFDNELKSQKYYQTLKHGESQRCLIFKHLINYPLKSLPY